MFGKVNLTALLLYLLLTAICLPSPNYAIKKNKKKSNSVPVLQEIALTTTSNYITENVRTQSSDEKILKETKKINKKVLENNISKEFFIDNIPEILKKFISIDILNEDVVTTKETIEIKGTIDPTITTYLNQIKLITSLNGKFTKTIKLEDTQKNQLFFVFILPNNKLFGVRKKIIKINSPVDINEQSENLKFYNYFFNSKYIVKEPEKKLNDLLTRADLAYFTYQFNSKKNKTTYDTYFSDVPDHHWAKNMIGYATEKKFMAEYADGLFYPEKNITRLESILTIVRTLDLPLSTNYVDIPFEDIPNNHWSTKFLDTAIEHKILKKSTFFYPHENINLKQFMDLVEQIPEVKNNLNEIHNFENGFDITDEDIQQNYSVALEEIKEREIQRKKLQKIEIYSPINNIITTQNQTVFEGKIFPTDSFYINDSIITPNFNGEFSVTQNITFGINNFYVDTSFSSTLLKVFQLDKYNDLKNHWIDNTAAQLQYLNFLPIENNFNAQSNITNNDFANYIFDFWNIATENIQELDVEKSPTSNHVETSKLSFLIENNIFYNNENEPLISTQNITRSESINAIYNTIQTFSDMELVNLHDDRTNKKFPFIDISKNHPNRESIQFCFNIGLLSDSHKFYPDKLISKAELIKILSNTPHIKQLTSKVFYE